MPYFKVTFAGGTENIIQAKNKTALAVALPNLEFTAVKVRRCKECHKAPSEVQDTLCQPCFEQIKAHCKEIWRDMPIEDQDLENLVISFFVDA